MCFLCMSLPSLAQAANHGDVGDEEVGARVIGAGELETAAAGLFAGDRVNKGVRLAAVVNIVVEAGFAICLAVAELDVGVGHGIAVLITISGDGYLVASLQRLAVEADVDIATLVDGVFLRFQADGRIGRVIIVYTLTVLSRRLATNLFTCVP